jgi:hypothetical protein
MYFKIFLKKNLLIQKSQTFVQNEGLWERNLQSSPGLRNLWTIEGLYTLDFAPL